MTIAASCVKGPGQAERFLTFFELTSHWYPQIELIAGADTQPHTDTCAAPSPRPMGSRTSRIPHPLAYLTLSHLVSHPSESHARLLAGALLTPFAPSPVAPGSGLTGAVASAR